MVHMLKDIPPLGSLRVKVIRGVNLAVRDGWRTSSDPYVVLSIGTLQKVRTPVVKRNVNPQWNEERTLIVKDPKVPVKLEVYDKDWVKDDYMGDAEFDIQPFVDALKKNLQYLLDGDVIDVVESNRRNCLAEDSYIYLSEGRVTQDSVLRLRNVECGEIELQLSWVSIPSIPTSKPRYRV